MAQTKTFEYVYATARTIQRMKSLPEKEIYVLVGKVEGNAIFIFAFTGWPVLSHLAIIFPAGLYRIGFFRTSSHCEESWKSPMDTDDPEAIHLVLSFDGAESCFLVNSSGTCCELQLKKLVIGHSSVVSVDCGFVLQLDNGSQEQFDRSLSTETARCCRLLDSRGCWIADSQSDLLIESSATSTFEKKFKSKSSAKLTLLRNSSTGREVESPVIFYDNVSHSCVRVPVRLRILALSSSPISSLTIRLKEVLHSVSSLLKYSKEQREHSIELHHFSPKPLDVPISVLYKIDEELPEDVRKDLHSFLILPFHCPFFRRCLRLDSTCSSDTAEKYLVDPHLAITKPIVDAATVEMVDGSYAYHHYKQDQFDDDGWGCAYRSLQTIVSWFRHQGYTEKPVPNHRQIQQILVDIGDKMACFVGSRKWIGSTEVGFVLENYLSVCSKFVCVNSGAEMDEKGRELKFHFQTQGTPIMIGGGVLAHTIIAISFDEVSGRTLFLVLDPHYTGQEDLKTIINKGWCGWKTVDFWDKNSFYNMCLPQRPSVI